MLYVLLGIFMFGILILIHELGHFAFAKLFKVGITEFAIGMGPKIFSKKGKDGVDYSLRLIPMGGFVSMVGEDEEVDEELADKALNKKPVWQRIIIVAAGAVTNILFGIILMGVIVAFSKSDIYSTTVEGFNVYYSDTNEVRVEDTWYRRGTDEILLQKGDKILKIGDRRINVRDDFIYEVMFLGNESVDVTVLRDGKKTLVDDVAFESRVEGGITLGIAGFIRTTRLEKTFPEVIKQAFCRSVASAGMIWDSLLNTVKGEYGTESLSGPVGIIEQVEETAKYGWDSLLLMVVIITLNLGIMNLLPLPALDGGRLFFMLIELIRGKPINPKYEGYVHAIGIVLLMGLMVFVTYNDIVRIFFS